MSDSPVALKPSGLTPGLRFAPSPTGYLHLGHAFSALFTADRARETGARLILRIEDIDHTRARPAFETALYEDLTWLGLDWEKPVRRQSEHLGDYQSAIDRLHAKGLVYRCFRTRADTAREAVSAPHGPGPVLTGAPLVEGEEAERLNRGEAFAWRLSQDRARDFLGEAFDSLRFIEEGAGPLGERGLIKAQPQRAGDIVLARKEIGVAYHLAVVVDDALQGITEVTRGCDLFEAAHIQVLLQHLLGLPTPTYRHHRLLYGEDGKRLAKRNGAPALRDLRLAGEGVADVRARLAAF